jgi:PIN domain nuclease of toxin-antitoxin system
VNLLLDTHAWLWLMADRKRIGKKTMELVSNGENNTFHFSVASVWEIAIKNAAGKLLLPDDPLAFVLSRCQENHIAISTFNVEHVCRAAKLPTHHADPFDRLIIAQAQINSMILMSHDTIFKKYDITLHDPAK